MSQVRSGFIARLIVVLLVGMAALDGCGSRLPFSGRAETTEPSRASLIMLPDIKPAEGMHTQSLGRRLTVADVNHLTIKLEMQDSSDWRPVLAPDGQQIGLDVGAAELGSPITIANLVTARKYRVKALAFSRPGTEPANQISDDALSETEILIGPEDRDVAFAITVQLSNTPFSGESRGGLRVLPGNAKSAPPSAVTASWLRSYLPVDSTPEPNEVQLPGVLGVRRDSAGHLVQLRSTSDVEAAEAAGVDYSLVQGLVLSDDGSAVSALKVLKKGPQQSFILKIAVPPEQGRLWTSAINEIPSESEFQVFLDQASGKRTVQG